MDGGRDHVAVLDGVRVLSGGDEPGEVRHVAHEFRADRIGDLAEAREIELARIGRPAGDDQLRPLFLRDPLDLVHVDPVVVLRNAVGNDLVELSRDVQLHPVREMTAVIELQAHDLVARIEQRHVDRVIGLSAGVGLDVRVLGAEERLRAVDRKLLADVNLLAAAVIAPAGIALRVLVGEHGAGGVQHGLRDEVLGRDHLERALLARELAVQDLRDLGVHLGERRGLKVVGKFGHAGLLVARCSGEGSG